jgi:hypothetical protein
MLPPDLANASYRQTERGPRVTEISRPHRKIAGGRRCGVIRVGCQGVHEREPAAGIVDHFGG